MFHVEQLKGVRQMAKIDEIRKQLASQNLISIEELQPHSIPEIIHEHGVRIQELELSKQDNKNVGYLSDYTDYYNKEYGWSLALQQMVDEGVKHIYINDGLDHEMKVQGMDNTNKPYCVSLDNQTGVTIECLNGSTLSFDYSQHILPNVFSCTNSEHITFKGVKFKGTGTRKNTQSRYALYTGCGIYTNKCNNIIVDDCHAHSTGYLVCLMDTDNSRVSNSTFKHDYYVSEWGNRMDKPYSAIILYSCKDSVVDNNVVYGGCLDGDISIFGGRTERCHIQNNKLYGYGWNDNNKVVYFANQGITYDQGCRDCIISQNILHGYYYGIDMKADTHNCLCVNNIIENTKVSIADRQGEATHNGKSQFNKIQGNKIILGHNIKGETLIHDYACIGILVEERQGCQIQNNDIVVSFYIKTTLGKSCGIYVSGREGDEHNSLYPQLIQQNSIMFCMFNNSTMFNTLPNSVAIHGLNLRCFDISHNCVKSYNANDTYEGVRLDTKATHGFIMYNTFFGHSSLGVKTDGATLTNVQSNLSL